MGFHPTNQQIKEFKAAMAAIEPFCIEHDIDHSLSYDSYYFVVDGKLYRVSNHTIEQSNRAAYDRYGNLWRPLYHDEKRDPNVCYIYASKTRIIEIYNNLMAGKKLDGRGNVIEEKKKNDNTEN
ncbi:MAG: hypothetical protein ACOX68_04820 [Candidatus Limivicinus sp.]|jgi:hypothetical protein